jgi:ABC-type polysaccharide/polyol phosphate export permease
MSRPVLELAAPARPGMLSAIRSIGSRWDLMYMITWKEIALKYKQSVMGLLWAVLMPIAIVSAGVVVRAGMAFLTHKPLALADVAAVSVKAVPWAFVVSGIRFATSSLIANSTLVTKIYMPREIFPLASVLAQFVDFGVACVPLAILLAFAGVGASVQLLWVLPLVVILVVLVSGLGIILSAGSLFFRDVKYLVEVVLTFAIFFTPVLFDVDLFGRWRTVLLLNPVAPLLEGMAAAVVRHQAPELAWVGYSAAVAVVGCLVALRLFRRLEPYFAESI